MRKTVAGFGWAPQAGKEIGARVMTDQEKRKLNKVNFYLTKKTLPAIEQLAEQLPGGFLLYREDQTRDVLFVNHLLLDMFECSTVEEFKALTGNDFHGMVYPDDVHEVQKSINRQINGEYGGYDHVEYRIVTRTGKIRWLDDYGHFGHSEDFGDVFYVFLFDITEKRRAQEAKNIFFYNMSHELLTPMNAVSTFIKLARRHTAEPAVLEDYLRSADEAAERMIGRIDEMVEINRRHELFSVKAVSKPIRVLIAEDNELNQMMLQTILEEAGFLVESVDDGDKAVEAVRTHAAGYYSVILMDIRMNVMDGHEATRRIRELPNGGLTALPILALSANSRDEDKAASLRCGMNGHLEKPYNPEQIISEIYRYARD